MEVIEDVYGAGPDLERAREHGYHRWTPIRGTGDQTDGYSYAGSAHEMAARTPMTDAERAAAAEQRGRTLTRLASLLGPA